MKKGTLILIINASVGFTGAVILVLFFLAPIFITSLLAICLISFLFMLTENWITHYAAEFENRFWTVMGFCLSCSCLFCQDSPICFPVDRRGVAWCIVVFFTYIVHNFDRMLRLHGLTRPPHLPRQTSREFTEQQHERVGEMLRKIKAQLEIIDLWWMSSTLRNIFDLPRVMCAEREIIALLAEALPDDLNYLLGDIGLPRILYKVKDHSWANSPNRSKLFDLLASERLHVLTVQSKVVLLDALQRLPLTALPHAEDYVVKIIKSTKLNDVSRLKNLMDTKGSVYSMHHLIYRDIRSSKRRKEILEFIQREACIHKAHEKIGSAEGRRRIQLSWRKIVSDVDDTLSCSGGSWPAGMDLSYPKKAIYPGVLAFYRELDLGIGTEEVWQREPGNLVFLSARPHVYKDISESATYDKFSALRITHNLYTFPTLLAGSLDSGSQFMLRGDPEPLAKKKFDNLCEYISIYPEFRFVFVGDNGQGDVRTAEMVSKDGKTAEQLQRVYIHAVKDRHKTHVSDNAFLSSRSICFFDTYIDAAIDACQHKLILAGGLRRVMEEAKANFLMISEESWLEEKVTSSSAAASSSIAKAKAPSSSVQVPTFHLLQCPRLAARSRGLCKRLHRLHDLNNSLRRGNAFLLNTNGRLGGKLAAVDLLPFPQLVALDAAVKTPLGPGVVQGFYAENDLYHIQLTQGKTILVLSGASLSL
eukprot:gene11102-12368_t